MRLALVNGGGRCWMPSTQTVSEPALRISVPLFTDMMYSASWTDLKNIVQWLRGHDESQWPDQIRLLSDTISDLEDSTESKTPQAAAIDVAMPHLIKMLTAMNGRKRVAALEEGQAALGLLQVE